MADNAPVIAAAVASPLLHHVWPDRRGVAPPGYTKGMAVAFAELYRLLKAGDASLAMATVPRTGVPAHDVLDYYTDELAAAGAPHADAGDRLVALFAVMLGLGMEESSGRHCDGPDTPTDRGPPGKPVPTTPENAEAGVFQVSYDSIGRVVHRQAIVDRYAGRTDLQAVFSEGAHCTKPDHWPPDVGVGPPAAFQSLMKECPLFAAHYTVMLLRERRSEWGTINGRHVVVLNDAIALFERVRTIVDAE